MQVKHWPGVPSAFWEKGSRQPLSGVSIMCDNCHLIRKFGKSLAKKLLCETARLFLVAQVGHFSCNTTGAYFWCMQLF